MNRDLKSWEEGASDFLSYHSEDKNIFKRLVDSPSYVSLLGKSIKDKKVLDVGCGNGDLCKQLAVRGANVVGLDGSEKMIKAAKRNFSGCEYVACNVMTDKIPFKDGYFDIVTAKMFLMYVASVRTVSKRIAKVLIRGGLFAVGLIHPFLPLLKSRTETKSRYAKDFNYFKEVRSSVMLGGKFFTYYYRPLNQYVNDIVESGFTLVRMQEPRINENFAKKYPDEISKLNKPVSLHLLFQKGGGSERWLKT